MELLDRRLSARDVCRSLSRVDREHGLEVLGRIAAVLDNADDSTAPEVQQRLLAGVLGNQSTAALERFRRLHVASGQVVAFEEMGVLLATRLLMCATPSATVAPLPFEQAVPVIGEAVLASNSLIRDERLTRPHTTSSGEVYDIVWAYYLHLVQLSRHNPRELSDIVIADEILSRISSERYVRDGCRRSFADVFESTTGLSLDRFRLLVFALQAPLRSIESETAANQVCFTSATELLSAGALGVSSHEVDRFLEQIASDFEAHRETARQRYPKLAERPFDHFSLFRRPVVRCSDKLYVPSLRLLRSKLGFGLAPTIIFGAPRPERNRLLDHYGRCVQQFVEEAVRSCFPDCTVVSDADVPTHSPIRNTKNADIVVQLEAQTVLLEVKTATVTEGVASGQGFEHFRSWLEPILDDCFAQFSGTIASLDAGQYRSAGISSSGDRIVPVIVTAFPLYPTHHLLSFVRRRAMRVLDPRVANRVVIATLGDFPILRRLHRAGENVMQSIQAWSDADDAGDRTLLMHLYRSAPLYARFRDEVEDRAFEGFMERIGVPKPSKS